MIKIIRARNIMVYIMAAVLILFMGISQVMPSYADTGGVNGGFVITDGVLTSYTGTDKEITIPDTVTEIGENAFKNSECTSVTIPSSVKKIGKSAFFNASVAKIDIPSSVESLDSMAFYAAKLKEVTFHEGLKTIGYGAFSEVYFPAGTVIEIPESVTEIGGDAFDSLGLGSAGGSSIKILNKDTVLGSGFAAYYNTVKIYGHKGSTAETYVTSQKESRGDKCKLEFVDIDSAQDIAVSSVTVTPSTLSLTTGSSE
ncbi:MAG: leucine-rich repeat domain-containing protein, partial [Anaerovoracaceae bacterium]